MELDPNFAAPYGLAATCYALRQASIWTDDTKRYAGEVRRQVSRLAGDDAVALARAGWALASVCKDFEDGAALIDLALSHNPNLAIAWTNRGMVSVLLGDHAKAIEQLRKARELSPIGSATNRSDIMTAMAYFFLGHNNETVSMAQKVLRRAPNEPNALGLLAAANALAGNIGEARTAVAKLREIAPSRRIAHFANFLSRAEDMNRAVEALRLAGLPE